MNPSAFWAVDSGPIVATVVFVVLAALALYHARSFPKKL